jgi:hypothetical protein
MRVLTSIALGALAAVACSSTPGSGVAEVSVEWQGDTRAGRAAIPARAQLCPETGLVEVLAIRGDTGVGMVLFPADSTRLTAGEYPVFHAGTLAEPRPGANLALRWFDRVTLDVFEGLEGAVRLDRAGQVLSGTFEARMRSVESSDSLQVSGRLDRVPLEAAPAGCAAMLRRNRM